MKFKRLFAAFMILVLVFPVSSVMKLNVQVNAAVSQEYVSVFTDIYTDKARYNPGDTVQITVEINNCSQSDITQLVVQPMHLNKKVGSPIIKDCQINAFSKSYKKIIWISETQDYQGYLLEITAKDKDGNIVDTGSVAVDVSSSWTKFPRYGYVYDFDKDVNVWNKIQRMNKYHINVIEYYDWQYLHHQPLAPSNMLEQGYYEDWSGRKIYVSTIKEYLESAKESNMANMAYDMIYAGTDSFIEGENNKIHKDWQVYFKDSNSGGQGPFYFTMGNSPSGNGHLYFMNPLNTSWQNHIFSEINKIFTYFDFDGWHGDTVGDWGEMTTADGQPLGFTESGEPIYLITDTYKQFLDAAKEALGDKYLTFNPVGAKGIINANKSAVDALYTEFWPWDQDREGNGYDTYYSLACEVERSAQDSGGKSLAVKSYINYNATDGYMNTPAVMLVNAAAFASGGNRLEIGNGDNIVHHEYYPNDGVLMNDTLKGYMRNMYDFAVAYENLLRDGQTTTNQKVVTQNYNSSKDGKSDTIWTYTREGNGYQMLHLINLLGTDNQWRDADRTKSEPREAKNIEVKYYYTSDINSVYLASPDKDGGSTRKLNFSKGEDESGKFVSFVVPSLTYWDMIYMNGDTPSELNERRDNEDYNLIFEAENYYEGNFSEGQADMQPGEEIKFTIPLGIQKGEYELSVISCGNRTVFEIEKDKESLGTIVRTGTGFGMNQMTEDILTDSVYLEGGEIITLKDNPENGSGYGWIDKICLKLKAAIKPEHTVSYDYPKGMIYRIEAENGELHGMDTAGNQPEIVTDISASEGKFVRNIGKSQGYVEMTVPEYVEESDYDLVLNYSSATNGKVSIWINNSLYQINYNATSSSWELRPGTYGVGNVHIKPGDKIKIQDAKDDCWMWLDYVYFTEVGTYPEETVNCNVKVDGEVVATVKKGETYILPKTARVGYYADGKMYKKGSTCTITKDIEFTSVNIEVNEGASIRLSELSGLTFKASISCSDSSLFTSGAIVNEGMLITTNDLYSEEGSLDFTSGYTYVNIENSGWSSGVSGAFTGSIAGIRSMNHGRTYIARAYMTVRFEDGTESTLYSKMTGVRSVRSVAVSMKNTPSVYDAMTTAQKVLIDKFIAE